MAGWTGIQRRLQLVLVAAFVLVLGSVPGRAEPTPTAATAEQGEWAPEGCWLCAGGAPSRASRTLSRAVEGTLEPSWQKRFEGTVEGEPRVWFDRVVVPVHNAGEERHLHFLNLSDGSAAGKPLRVKSSYPLRPSIHESEILIRTGLTTVGHYRFRRGRTSLRRAWDLKVPVIDLVWWRGAAYVMTTSAISKFVPAERNAVWHSPGEWTGRFAITGDQIFAVKYESGTKNMDLFALSLDNGRMHSKVGVGYAEEGQTARPGKTTSVVVLDDFVLVNHRWPVNATGGKTFYTSRIKRHTAGGRLLLEDDGLFPYRTPVVGFENGYFCIKPDKQGSMAAYQYSKYEKPKTGYGGWLLGDREAHKDMVDAMPNYAVAGKICFAGMKSFHVETLQVGWDARKGVRFPPVPVRDTLLVVPQNGPLTAYREQGRAARRPYYVGAAYRENKDDGPTPGTERRGDILFVDGEVISGKYAYLADRSGVETMTEGTKVRKTSHAMARVRAIADGQGQLQFVSSLQDIVPAATVLMRNRNADAFCALARRAIKVRDPKLLAELIEYADERGGDEKRLKTPRKKQAEYTAKPKTIREKTAPAIRAETKALLEGEDVRAFKAVEALLDDPRPHISRYILEQVLRAEPKNERAVDTVRKMLPDFVQVPSDFDARAWLELATALQLTPVRRVDPPQAETPNMTLLERELGAATHYWRKDLVGLQSEQVFFVTPFKKPANTAMCLTTAELVCDAMEDFFADQPQVRKNRKPLVIQAFDSPEYYAHVLTRGQPDSWLKRNLKHLVGRYFYSQNLTRVIVPSGADATRRVLDTFASELTDHWMDHRCPMWTDASLAYDKEIPGAWAYRGLPYFLADWRWNLGDRSWTTLVPSSWTLDLVANATEKQRLDWSLVFGLSDRKRKGIPREPKSTIHMRFNVGWSRTATPRIMYAAQGAATWSYLHHQGGKLRDGVMRLLRDWNQGKVPKDGAYVQQYFGMDAKELGKRVVAWARDVQRGKAQPKVKVTRKK